MGSRGQKIRHMQMHVRVCPLSFSLGGRSKRLGMTMFHEVMHLTSAAGDFGYAAS